MTEADGGPRCLAAAALLLAIGGCTGASSSRPLAGQPPHASPSGVYIVTRAPAAPYRTVGLVQIKTHGSGMADAEGKSDTDLDPAVHALLANAIHDAGAEGAILVDFEDVLPPTAATRPWAVVRGAPPGRIDTRSRWLEVQAELFVFVRPGASR